MLLMHIIAFVVLTTSFHLSGVQSFEHKQFFAVAEDSDLQI